MKVLLSLLLIIVISNLTIAQTTAIPDANFEQALIGLGYDNVIDGSVLTANISTVNSLNLANLYITDLTGIEDFTTLTDLNCSQNQLTSLDVTHNIALTDLSCGLNQLTNLDVTQNTALTLLWCAANQLTSLDITNNTALVDLNCYSNQLTSLNVTQNTALSQLRCGLNQFTSLDVTQNTALTLLWCTQSQLTSLDVTQNTALTDLNCREGQFTNLDVTQNVALTHLICIDNQLTSLNVSQNTALIYLSCGINQLTCLNIKNGNNTSLAGLFANNNPHLTCVEVDNVSYSTSYWNYFDPQTYFSTNCNNSCTTVGIKEQRLNNISISPNPTIGSINIDLEETKSSINLQLINAIGQVILTQNYKPTDHVNINLDTPKGVYFLQLESDDEVITKKIIKQ